ncbi:MULTISPECIES: hypothetical protein [Neorhizobium]|jgi:hypothetical protein|uniref:hypothetical protein n=1 Tax=Neorhizobium TaxID=1525371 RepID=UPI000CF958F3|nr:MULTISPECIES: hypothetical protein [Neorhizobium]
MQEPTLLADVFKALVDAGQVTKEDLREDLPLFPHDVESLTGLPSGWLSLQAARIVELKPVATPRDNLGGARGEVIPIKRNSE